MTCDLDQFTKERKFKVDCDGEGIGCFGVIGFIIVICMLATAGTKLDGIQKSLWHLERLAEKNAAEQLPPKP
jgi:hypothetical protein